MTNRQSEKISGYYDEFSRRYSHERNRGYFSFVNELEFSLVARELVGKRVLEVGCGTGLIMDLAKRAGPKRIVGVDLSEGMVEQAQKGGHDALLGSATALPFEDGSFDVVYSFKVLPHVPDLSKALSEMVRVCAPGGVVFAELYNPWSFKGLWDSLPSRRAKVYLRHDAPPAVRRALPADVKAKCVGGVRIFGPAHFFYVGMAGRLFRALDRWALRRWFRWLAGYQIWELRRDTTCE